MKKLFSIIIFVPAVLWADLSQKGALNSDKPVYHWQTENGDFDVQIDKSISTKNLFNIYIYSGDSNGYCSFFGTSLTNFAKRSMQSKDGWSIVSNGIGFENLPHRTPVTNIGTGCIVNLKIDADGRGKLRVSNNGHNDCTCGVNAQLANESL